MSSDEQRLWLWLLGILGVSALLSIVLPAHWLILLFYFLIGILIVYSFPVFFYVAGFFCVNWVVSRFWSKPWGLRVLTVGVLLLMSGGFAEWCLNRQTQAEYDRIAAADMPLAAYPDFTRLVIVDDRSNPSRQDTRNGKEACSSVCAAYLHDRQGRVVLLVADLEDMRPVDQRHYLVFTDRAPCVLAVNPQTAREQVRQGECLAEPSQGSLAVGDLMVKRADFRGPGQGSGPDDERTEAYLMTTQGLKLIMRQTSFLLPVRGDLPMPVRDVQYPNVPNDKGIQLERHSLKHWRPYDNVMTRFFGLPSQNMDSRSIA